MRADIAEMKFLYSHEIVSSRFSKENFHQFLQEDQIFPLKGVKQTYLKNDIIIMEEEAINEVYFIESGHVAAMKGEDRVIDFFTENDIMGLTKLLLDTPSEYSFKVISKELVVTKYDKESIIEKVINTQEGYFYHYIHMQDQMVRMAEKVALLRLPAEQRISSALLHLCEEFGKSINDPDLIFFPKQIGRGMIAKYINVNRNTITNVVQRLVGEDIIYPARNSLYIDIFKLQKKIETYTKL